MTRPTEYTYTLSDGWRPLPRAACKLPPLAPDYDVGDALFHLGYRILGASPEGRCGLGHFHIWQRDSGSSAKLPRYALEVLQVGEAGVIWIVTIPDLWEFLRLYGEIGVLFNGCLPGDHDDDEDDEDDRDKKPNQPPLPPSQWAPLPSSVGDAITYSLGTLLPFRPKSPHKFN